MGQALRHFSFYNLTTAPHRIEVCPNRLDVMLLISTVGLPDTVDIMLRVCCSTIVLKRID